MDGTAAAAHSGAVAATATPEYSTTGPDLPMYEIIPLHVEYDGGGFRYKNTMLYPAHFWIRWIQ